MQLINGGIQNIVLFLAGLILLGAGGVLIRFRDIVAQYLRQLRSDIFGKRAGVPVSSTRPPLLPIIVGVILIAFGLIGAAGGLFATLPPLGTPRT